MFCTKCGNKLDDNARFCNNCGASTGVADTGGEVYEEAKGDAHNGTQGETYRDQADGYYENNQGGAYGGNRAGYSAPEGYAPYAPKAKKSKKPLIIGISIAAAVIVIAVVIVLIVTLTGGGSAGISKSVDVGDTVTFGSYEQDNNTSNGKEDIEWIVLDKEDGKALLISKYILDCQPYNEEYEEITWEDCTLREWLNNDFLNTAFSSSQKNAIALSDIENDDNPEYDTEGGEDTEDKVFLLSLDEVENYFDSDDDRIAKLTDYGKERCMEEYAEMNEKYGWGDTENEAREEASEYIEEYEEEYGGWYWWLRSPGDYGDRAAYVYDDGYVDDDGYGVRDSDFGVRPALWVNLES